ncbi:helix-turn-helix domain-containing protein [Sphingomonas sp. CFBP 13720]|uniref:helix-turn-helix domain-containing protein n=1 Tax=Sphingomonas sp. CFBP 13720 TaxID=2775302 RepID=UPI00313A469A
MRRQRKLADMSQEELLLRTGNKLSYVSDLERRTRDPTVKALGQLADGLRIEPSALLIQE